MSLRMTLCLAAALFLSTGCSSPGEVGDPCDESGAVDQCVDGAVCTQDNGAESNTCRTLCEVQEDCGASESCNGVAGSNLKSCQPAE